MNGVINGVEYVFTKHAVSRIKDMNCADDVRAVLEHPRHMVPCSNGTEKWTRGKVTIVVAPHDGYWSVVTVLWATAHLWVEDSETVQSRRGEEISPETLRAARYAIKQRKKGRLS